MTATLTVQGFTGHLLALNGKYQQQDENHGKPTYKKRAEMDGTTQCSVYYWDERDGDELAGWWMAPEVGGEQVWAHCVNSGPTPPKAGWKVPWHTSQPDPKVSMELTFSRGGASGGNQQQQQQSGGGQWNQGRSNQSGSGGRWGDQSNNYNNNSQQRNQDNNNNAGGYKRGWESSNNNNQDKTQESANKYSRQSWGSSGGAYQSNRDSGGNKAAAAEEKAKAQKENALKQLTQGMTAAENAVGKLSGPESKEANFDLMRHISMAKSALSSAQRCLEGHTKSQVVDQATLTSNKNKLSTLERTLNAAEEKNKAAQKAKLEALKSSYINDLTALIVEAEKLVEKTKDAAVLFTCEMAEHIKPEDAMEAKEKTDAEAVPAGEALKKVKDLIFAKDKEIRGFPQTDVAPIRESIKPLSARLASAEKELGNVKTQATAASRKAQVTLSKIKREQEAEKARVEREKAAAWNRALAGLCYQIGLVADDVVKSLEGSDVYEDKLAEGEAKLRGLRHELQKKHDDKDCAPQSKQNVMKYMRQIDGHLGRVKQLLKEQRSKDLDKVRQQAVLIAAATRKRQGERTEEEFFAEITGKTNKMDQAKFEEYIKTLEVEADRVSVLFKEACKFVSSDCTVLTKEMFFLLVANSYHSAVKATPIHKELDVKSEKVGTLEAGAVVQVLEGPTDVDGAMRVKIVREKKQGAKEEGFTTLRENGVENFVRFSPHYTVLSETVLTNTFDLKGFKVVRRIKADEKFLATGIPKHNVDSDMWRISGITDANENVWVTIQGNRGTSLLRNEPMTEIAAAEAKASEKMEEFSEEKLNVILLSMADSSRKNLQKFMSGTVDALKGIKEKMVELEAADEEGKEPTKEEVAELRESVEVAFAAYKEAGVRAARQIQLLTGNLRNVESGPYHDLKVELPTFSETLAEQKTEIKEMHAKRRTLENSVNAKECERRMAREKEEQERLAHEILTESAPREEKLTALFAKLTALDKRQMPDMISAAAEYQNVMKSTAAEIAAIKEEALESRTWVEEKMPKSSKAPLLKAMGELKKIRANVAIIANKCVEWSQELVRMGKLFKEKLRVELAVLLKAYLESKKIDEEALFKTLADGKDTLSVEAFGKFAMTLIPGIDSLDDVLKQSLGSITEMTKDHIAQLTKATYRCMKRALITDIIDIKTCKKLKTIEQDEIVTVLDKHVSCEKTGLTRFKGRTSDGTEGYVTIKGNVSSVYFKFQQSYYRVVKETVFTDNFEMKNFKVLRRLKEGDYIRELSLPEVEEKSGLYRMKAQTVDDNEIGWVTLKGNAGSQFLVNCELPSKDAAKGEETSKEQDIIMKKDVVMKEIPKAL